MYSEHHLIIATSWAVLNAENAGPFTLDGTRSWIVGERDVVVIDPGPDVLRHIRALASEVSGAASVTVALTHGHADHAAGADALAELTDGRIVGPDGVE